MKKLHFLIVLFVFIVGCETTNQKAVNSFKYDSQNNTYEHENSGFLFPPSIGEFERGNNIKNYDSAGNNISVPYNFITKKQKIAGTVFVYPGMKEYAITPVPKFGETPNWFFEKHYIEVKDAIVEAYRARLLSEQDFNLNRSLIDNQGKKAVFEYDAINGETVHSHLYLFPYKGWLVKYRFTYPSKYDDMA